MAACLSFADPGPDSGCKESSADIVWLNPPSALKTLEHASHNYESLIADPAFSKGVYLDGGVRFEFRARGKHLVEVFLMAMEEGKDSFGLEVDGKATDSRYELKPEGARRLRPKKRIQYLSLLGMVKRGQVISLRTDSARYVLSAIRWTPGYEFETRLVPKYLKRVRSLFQDPFDDEGRGYAFTRRSYLEQLCSRLALSEQENVRQEAAVGLARAIYWLAAENHERHDIDRAKQAMHEALKLAPEDPILQQTVSASCLKLNVGRGGMPGADLCREVAPIPWEVSVPAAPSGAPDWAVAQRKLVRRMDAITRWWIEKRMHPSGELGGGWGDDVEILRSWGPQALGFGSAVAVRGIRRLADGLWSSGTLLDGYYRWISDVEHSSEPTTDTQPLRVAIAPEEREARDRLGQTAACARNWIDQQPDGHWRFRGAWFNCHDFDPSAERALDVHLNTRAMGPVLWYAYLTREPALIELLANWAESWVEATRSTKHGKPAGIFPSVVRSKDGSYLIGSDEWDKPDAEWDYFQWSGSAQEALTSLLLAMYDLTGEKRWLEAAGESFQILDQCHSYPKLCEEILRAPQAFFEWRRLSGDGRYDKVFGHQEELDVASLRSVMAKLAKKTEARLAVNFDMFTSEVIFTDRVYYTLPPVYKQHLFGGESPRGDRYPTFAVTWPVAEGEFARLVIEAAPTQLKLLAYNLEPVELKIPVRVWRLEPGQYRWEVRNADKDLIAQGKTVVSQRAQIIEYPLPPHEEVQIAMARN